MLQIVLLAGKFIFLIILYLFIYRVIRSASRELRGSVPAAGRPVVPIPAAGYPGVQAEGPSSAPHRPAPAGAWALIVRQSPSVPVGQRYVLPVGTHALVGRAPEMDISLDDTFVSSKHALFEATDVGLQVEDLRSTNGTQVNSADITEVRILNEGDRVEIGDTVFQVEPR